MNKSIGKIKKGLVVTLVAVASVPCFGQDVLASAAPVDKIMRAIDSLAISRLINEEVQWDLDNPAADLYNSWTNKSVRLTDVTLPAEHRIDLRQFCMPASSRLVTSRYGYRRSFRRQHYGTDIKVYVGDTIRAAFSGKVRVVAYEGKGYGKYIVMRHPNGLETVYGHLSKQLVKEDQVVKVGEPIGLGGNTGRSTGSHLHFETRFLGQFINPEKLFNFEAQDIQGDYYVFRSNGQNALLAAHEIVGGESEMSEEEAAALEKAEESQAFQQRKIAERQQQRAKVHRVRKGESLYTIAKKYGTTVEKLCKANNITKRTTLRPGQILKYS